MPPVQASLSQVNASSSSCPIYIGAISQAAIAIGDASGRQQVYDAIVNSDLPFAARLAGDLAKAERDVVSATARAQALGQPPTSCGALTRATLTKPGIVAAQDQAIRAAYYRVGAVAGGADEQQFRKMADDSYPESKVVAQRASYDALVKQLQSELGKQQLAVR